MIEMKTLTIGGNTFEVVDETVRNKVNSIIIEKEGGNFNNSEIVFGSIYTLSVGKLPATTNVANRARSSDLIPAIGGKTVYTIFENITTDRMRLICYDVDKLLISYFDLKDKGNKANMGSSALEFTLPENTAYVAFYISDISTTDCKVGLYYTPYEATTVEEYSESTRYVDGTKIMKDGKVVEVETTNHTHTASDIGAYTKEEVAELINDISSSNDDLSSFTIKRQNGNINNVAIEAGGYSANVGKTPTTFSHDNITRCTAPISVMAGETIYVILEGTTTKYLSICALDKDGKTIASMTNVYAKNLTSGSSLQTLYTIPDGCTSIIFYANTAGSIDYNVGIYYDFYETTVVEEYVEPSIYVYADKLIKNGKIIEAAETSELNKTKDRIGFDKIAEANIPKIDEPDVEYSKHILAAVRGEMVNMWKYLETKHEVTILDEGVCGPDLAWKLYSDGLLKISGTGRAYDYCKGLFGDKITRAEIEEYQVQYEGKTDADSIAKYERGFQEGKIYDDEHGQYIAPWYKYRPEFKWVEDYGYTDGYITKTEYDRDNPNGWTYNRIEIDEGITYLGNWMFYRVCGATELVIPSTVTAIGQWCIRYSPSLKCIYLPDGVATIEKRGCSRNEVAEVIRLGEGFTTIGDYAFAQNPMVKNLHIKGNITSVGKNLFDGNYALETITLDGITEINGFWFGECDNITRVQLSEGLTTIAPSAFVNRANLTTVNIPSTVTTIGQSAFYGCTNLEYLYIDSPTVAQGLVDASSTANFGHVNYYSDYIYVNNNIDNVGTWFNNRDKYSDINGYTLYVRKNIS